MSINMSIGIFVVACNGVNSVDAFFPSHHHTIRHRSGRVDAVNNSERSHRLGRSRFVGNRS